MRNKKTKINETFHDIWENHTKDIWIEEWENRSQLQYCKGKTIYALLTDILVLTQYKALICIVFCKTGERPLYHQFNHVNTAQQIAK